MKEILNWVCETAGYSGCAEVSTFEAIVLTMVIILMLVVITGAVVWYRKL